MLFIYNYHFRKANDFSINTHVLEEGGPKVGTTTSGGWIFDGQIFKLVPVRWHVREQPKIVKVYK